MTHKMRRNFFFALYKSLCGKAWLENLRINSQMRSFALESERSFRVSKVRQSVSKCFRTEKGLSCFAAIMSVLDTAKKNGINRIEMIKAVFDGTADTLLAPVLS